MSSSDRFISPGTGQVSFDNSSNGQVHSVRVVYPIWLYTMITWKLFKNKSSQISSPETHLVDLSGAPGYTFI